MTITREQAIKDIISTAVCLEHEYNSQEGKMAFLFKDAAIDSLKALGVTQQEIHNAAKQI